LVVKFVCDAHYMQANTVVHVVYIKVWITHTYTLCYTFNLQAANGPYLHYICPNPVTCCSHCTKSC